VNNELLSADFLTGLRKTLISQPPDKISKIPFVNLYARIKAHISAPRLKFKNPFGTLFARVKAVWMQNFS